MSVYEFDQVLSQPVIKGEWIVFQPKIKILLVYIVYPLAMATYFKKALEHRDDVDLKVAGPYTGSWIPWGGGMNVLPKYAISPDVPLDYGPSIGEINYETIKARLGDWIPDIIINIDAGLHFRNKPTDGMVVTVGTDPHVLNDWYDAPRKYSDKFFNMQKVYSKVGDSYLPYAYSKYDFYPEDIPNPDDAVDAVLIGMPYATRVQWKQELEKRGVKIILENGPIFDEARALYNRGKIGLNWSSLDDLNCRVFEIPAMKLYPVVNNVTDLWEHECLHHHHIFNNMNEAVEAVMWAKDNPDKARDNAEIAYDLIQGQTYDARVGQILKECGFI